MFVRYIRHTYHYHHLLSRQLSTVTSMNASSLPEIFRPPVDRSMRVLNRDFFQKTLPISAATVFDDRMLSSVQTRMQRDGHLLGIAAIKPIVADENVPGRKCVLLRPEIVSTG